MAAQNIVEFLSTLRKLDVRVWAENGQLRANAPNGVLTPELRAELASRKAEILTFLLQADQAAQAAPPIQAAPRRASIPLSFSQHRIWLFDQIEPQNPAYNIPASVRLIGPLDVPALRASIDEVIRRHEMLRTTFSMVNGEVSQVIAPSLSLDLAVTDLRSLPGDQREGEARRLAHAEAGLPFDLSSGPLVRASLLRLGDEEYVLLLTIHHIVSDDWSMGVFVGELATLYQAFTAGQPSPLLDLPIQYADYALWQRGESQKSVLQSQLEFWTEKLAAVASLPPIPTDRPRLGTQTFRGERRFRMLPQALAERLKALSQEEESTLFMCLLAAFNILLWQYMGRDRVVIGSPVAGRTQREIEALVGFFVNTVALHIDLSGDPSFRQLLAWAREVTMNAYSHQDVPFEQVVDALRPEREQNQTPIFQIFFNMLNAASQRVEIPGLKIEPFSDFIVGAPNIGAKFDLTLVAVEHPHGLQADISYNIDLFAPATIDWLLEHLQTILESAVADPDRPLSAFPRLPVTGRNRTAPANPHVEFPLEETGQSLAARFEKHVRANPDRLAVSVDGKTMSYEQLNRAANRLAHWIQKAESGFSEERTVSLLLGHDAGTLTGMLAALKCGQIFTALDPAYPRERLAQMLADSRTSLIVSNTEHLTLAEDLRRQAGAALSLLNLDQLDASLPADDLSLTVDPDRIAYIVYTSGSTGRPKGVTQSHRNVLHFIRNYTNTLHISPDDRLSLIPSFSFSAAMMDTFGALLNGASLFPFDVLRQGIGQLGAWLNENRITIYHSVPTIFRHLVAALSPGMTLPHLRLIDFGGEPVTRRDIESYRRHFSRDCLLVNGLGATELNVIRQFVLDHSIEFLGDNVPVGYEVPDTKILLLDEQGNDAGFNQPGEIVIESRYLSPGYWQQPEQTQAAFRVLPDGRRRYYTGDLGRLRPDGCLEHYGRKDLQVKIRGVRIEPAEIEAALLELGPIREATVVARDNPLGEKVLVAYMVARETGASLSDEALRSSLLDKLPPSMLPSEFVWLEAMPVTHTGKVDRRALPEPGQALPETRDGGYVAPRTPMEQTLVKIGQEILKIERIGVNDSFFNLGGDSLLAAQFVSRVRGACQVELPFRVLFRTPTIAEAAKYVEDAQMKQRLQAAPATLEVGRDEGEL